MLDKFDARAFLIDQFLIKSGQRYPDITVDALELAFAWGESLGPMHVKKTQAQLEQGTRKREKNAKIGSECGPPPQASKFKGSLTKERVLRSFYKLSSVGSKKNLAKQTAA